MYKKMILRFAILFSVAIISIFIITACDSEPPVSETNVELASPEVEDALYEPDEPILYEPIPSPEVNKTYDFTFSIPLERAAQYIAEMQELWDNDDGALWGMRLDAPFMFISAETREAVASRADRSGMFIRVGDVYTGVIPPEQHIGNTAVMFDGEMWGMATWSLVELLSADEPVAGNFGMSVLQLIVHESFHAIKEDFIGGTRRGTGADFTEFDMERNILIRLELNALLNALIAESMRYMERSIRYALSIRSERKYRDLMNAEDIELEIAEGITTYNDLMLLFTDPNERIDWIEDYVEHVKSQGGTLRLGAGYAFGALYGLLLDEFSTDWRTGLTFQTDLGQLLKDAVGITELPPFDELDLEAYGYLEAVAREEVSTEDYENMRRAIEEAFYNQPILIIDYFVSFSLGEVGLTHIDDRLSFFGDMVIYGTFGQITLQNAPAQSFFDPENILGARNVLFGYMIPATDISVNGLHATGKNWELELNEGFEIVETAEGNFLLTNQNG